MAKGVSSSCHEQLLWEGNQIAFGRFQASPSDDDFDEAGPIGGRSVFAFPHTPVEIRQEARASFLADPTIVVVYNPHQPYRRASVAGQGDRCEWLSVDPALLFEMNPCLGERPDRPFSVGHLPLSAPIYLVVRLVSLRLSEGLPAFPWIEEWLIRVIAACLSGPDWPHGSPGTRARRSELVRTVKEIVIARLDQGLTVTSVASLLGVSPYHLCRVFRAETGYTLHGYLTEMRLRIALEYLTERADELTEVALSLGFCSHSHFTAAFRKRFGQTPSEFRALRARGPLRLGAQHEPFPALGSPGR